LQQHHHHKVFSKPRPGFEIIRLDVKSQCDHSNILQNANKGGIQ